MSLAKHRIVVRDGRALVEPAPPPIVIPPAAVSLETRARLFGGGQRIRPLPWVRIVGAAVTIALGLMILLAAISGAAR